MRLHVDVFMFQVIEGDGDEGDDVPAGAVADGRALRESRFQPHDGAAGPPLQLVSDARSQHRRHGVIGCDRNAR